MYRVFFYRFDIEDGLFIVHEEECTTLEAALKCVVFFEDNDLFEITKDVSCSYGSFGLKTVARPASMCAYLNSYYSRW